MHRNRLLISQWLSSSYHHLFRQSARLSSIHSTSIDSQITTNHKINVRKMDKKDLQLVKNWAINERWNPGLYEVDALYAADPNGYYLLEIDKEPVASLASVR